jgi:hypothetical protein
MSIIKPCCDCPETFLELNDTPNSYLGQRGKLVAVKPTEDGLEFVDLNISGNQILFFNTVEDLHLQDTSDLNDNQIAYVKETNNFYYLRKNGVNKGTPYDPLRINVYSSVNGIWVNMHFKVVYFGNGIYPVQDGLCPETAFNINVFNNIIIRSALENLYIYYKQDILDAIKRSLSIYIENINSLHVISPNSALILNIECEYAENFYISYGDIEVFEVDFHRTRYSTINNLHLDGSSFHFMGNYKIRNVFLYGTVNNVSTQHPFDFASVKEPYHPKILSPTIAIKTDDVFDYYSLLTYDTDVSFTLIDDLKVRCSYISAEGDSSFVLLKYKIHYNTVPKYFNILNDLPFNKRFSNGQYFELILKEQIKNVPECCHEYDTTRKKYVLRSGQIQYFIVDRSIIQNSHVGAILLNIIVEGRLRIRTDTGSIGQTINNQERWFVLSKKEFATITNNIDSYFIIENPDSDPSYFLMKIIYLYL